MPPPSPTTTTNAPKRPRDDSDDTDSTARNVDDDVPFLQSFVVRLASMLVAPRILAKDVGNHATASSFALYWRSPVLIPNLRDVVVAEPEATDPEEHDDDDLDDDDDAEVVFVDATFAFRSSVSSSSSSPTPRADVRFGVFCLHRRGRRPSSSDEEASSSSSRRRPYVRGSYQQGSPLSFDDLRRHFEGVGFDLPRLDENGRAIDDDDDDDDVPRNAPSSLAAWLGGALRRVGRGAPTVRRTVDAFVDAITNDDDDDHDRVRRRVLRLGVGPYRDLPTNELPLGVYSPERHRILPSPRGPLDMFLRNLDGEHGSAAADDDDDDDDDESSRSKSLSVLSSWWREATRSRSPDDGAAATRDAIDSNPEEESTERRDAAFSSRSGSVASSSSPTLPPALKRPRFGQTLVHQHSFVKRPLRKKISVRKLT